ncbi:2OG-Fe(II) oxygenase, putative [Bodo saltans]|uniref:2OG-Fe(II) oxygenase, putative n=2 Tax=Bodo saltans TaxID=75058 RepID=A0A0S4IUI7_BODSA|nr:2OG-Fe(II) oxygenase, putative [Bodo saltans]|eukprot:CUF98195.1 2OG-Fe(II) oxygenase, putative [Bodo saltans]
MSNTNAPLPSQDAKPSSSAPLTTSTDNSVSENAAENQLSKVAGDDYYNIKPRQVLKFFKPTTPDPWDGNAPQALMIFESLIANNYAILDNFIDPEEGRLLRNEIQQLYRDGRMVDGKIGKNAAGTDGDVRPDMRTDKMVWMEGSEPFVGKYLKRHILRADILAQKINLLLESMGYKDAWEGCSRCKIMATCYPEGGKRYVAHYDNPNRNGRKLTIILYLNEWWKEGDGGVLRAKTNGVQLDVAPLFNRLFAFWSDRRVPHEVLPTAAKRDRFAITIWYMDDAEKRLGPL